MLATVKTAATVGLEGQLVDVEVDISSGLPALTFVGDTIIRGRSTEPTDYRMNKKPNISRIIREQRKQKSLSLKQLSRLSGVSISHLGRIEQGLRRPSTRTIQKIVGPLDFDLQELLIITGHLLPGQSTSSEEQRDELRTELNTLLERVVTDTNRIKEIVNRLLLSR